jgi:hypothetical protein
MTFRGALRGVGSPLGRIHLLEKLTERLLWRLPRQVAERHLEVAPPLPQSMLDRAKLYADRETMLHALPKGGTVAEVGVWRGDFSKLIWDICEPVELHLIDVDFAPFNWPAAKAVRHQGDSSAILRSFKPGSFDWIYIDGDHAYEGVCKDLAAAHVALKPGGYLMCNDYANWCSLAVTPYGVARAVNEFILREGYSVEGFALHPAGLPDILIRKPA